MSGSSQLQQINAIPLILQYLSDEGVLFVWNTHTCGQLLLTLIRQSVKVLKASANGIPVVLQYLSDGGGEVHVGVGDILVVRSISILKYVQSINQSINFKSNTYIIVVHDVVPCYQNF